MFSPSYRKLIVVVAVLLGVLTFFIYFYERYTFQEREKRLTKQMSYLSESFWNLNKSKLNKSLKKIMEVEGLSSAIVFHHNRKFYTFVSLKQGHLDWFERLLRQLFLIRETEINVPIYYNKEFLGYLHTEWPNANIYVYLYLTTILTFLGIIIHYHLAYRDREKSYRELVENANSAMVRWNREGNIVFFNEFAEAYFGYSQEEIIGKPLIGTILPETETTGKDLRQVMDNIQKNPEKHDAMTLEGQRKDGKRVWVSWTHREVKDATGGEASIFSIGSDITNQKQAEKELATAQEELVEAARLAGKAEIASNVLHNVGNVLTSIKTIVSILKKKKYKLNLDNFDKALALLREHHGDLREFLAADSQGTLIPEYLQRFSSLIQQEQQDAEQLLRDLNKHINTITDIISIQQTHAKPRMITEKTDLVKLTEDVLRIDLPSIEKNDIQVSREYDVIKPVKLDRHYVTQILLNLIKNALDSLKSCNKREKRLTLRIHRSVGEIRIDVIDNGVGIASENQAHIFTYGFTTKSDGHGFGLHGSANLAKSFKARLTFHSDGVGKGACFSLILPTPTEPDPSHGHVDSQVAAPVPEEKRLAPVKTEIDSIAASVSTLPQN